MTGLRAVFGLLIVSYVWLRYADAIDEADIFNLAVKAYNGATKHKSLRDLDISKAHSWDDVIREYEYAQRKYADKAKGWLGFPRKAGRSIGDNADRVYPFLAFIPDGDYFTPIRAALHLIFGV